MSSPLPSLRRASLIFALGVAAAAASPAIAGDASKPWQVAQNLMPPAAVPGGGDDAGDASESAQLVLRIDRLEGELRRARGDIEELQNENRRLADDFKRFREDVEFRLTGRAAPAAPVAPPPVAQAAPGTTGPLTTTELAPAPKPRKSDAFDPNADPNALGAPRPLGSTAASAPLDIGVHAAPAATPLAATAKPPEPTGPMIVSSGLDFNDAPRAQFNAAVEAYKAGQYAAAEEQFRAFLAANGTHRLAPDAVFYLGETYLQRSRPREAAEQYLKLSTDFAKSPRAPDGMMRLGQSLVMLGSVDQACATYAEIGKRYPQASSVVKKTVEREMQKNHC